MLKALVFNLKEILIFFKFKFPTNTFSIFFKFKFPTNTFSGSIALTSDKYGFVGFQRQYQRCVCYSFRNYKAY